MKNFVRLTANLANGKRTVWAVKLGPGIFRVVDSEGQWGSKDGKDHRFILSDADIIKEQPAQINKTYGTLEVIS